MQRPVEIILTRQLVEYLSTPAIVADSEGNLVFYNEQAHRLLGRAYEEADEVSIEDVASSVRSSAEDGTPLSADQLPIMVALRGGRPCHRRIRITALDGGERLLEVTATPLVGQGGRTLGVLAVFWDLEG